MRLMRPYIIGGKGFIYDRCDTYVSAAERGRILLLSKCRGFFNPK